jgi:uncharacterized protein (DUF1786 family)
MGWTGNRDKDMKILIADIGTGTQDIFLYDSQLDLENSYKLVLPSPTMIIRSKLRQATRQRQAVLLAGVTMGGGPSAWAVEAHLNAGLMVYALPDAARTINDDLEKIQATGITLVSDDEALRLPETVQRIELGDFNFPLISHTLEQFSVSLDHLAAVAVAVFDHGDAPRGISDRRFRFDYLDRRIRAENRLSAFAYCRQDIPPSMTRLQAVGRSANGLPVPLVVMDTAPAAVLGATFDPQVAARPRIMIANIGNFHTLAFRLGPTGVEGMFEHHTGEIDLQRLEALLLALAGGTLKNEDVFKQQGHGALIYSHEPFTLDTDGINLAVTGPRRNLLKESNLRPYFAAPFGDMMITGCYGLLAATADAIPELGETIRNSLLGPSTGKAPWEEE